MNISKKTPTDPRNPTPATHKGLGVIFPFWGLSIAGIPGQNSIAGSRDFPVML